MFCALLEFTFVNYMFRKPAQSERHKLKRKNLAGAENGEAGAPGSAPAQTKASADGDVATEAVSVASRRVACVWMAERGAGWGGAERGGAGRA